MRTRLILTAIATCATAPGLWSQTRVYVSAPNVTIVASDSMQLSAVARNTNGDLIANATFQWSSSATNVAQVDSSGKLTTAALGFADITANYAGTQGILRVQVLPQRIDISPADTSITYGSQQQFTAVAYDSKGKPIPNVTFAWHLGLFSGGDSSTNSMRNGLVTASTLGYYMVRAAVTYPFTSEQFQMEFDGQTPLRIVPPALYNLSQVASNDYARPQFALKGRRTSMAATDDGTLYFSGILDGMANGLMQYSGGAVSAVALAGSPSFLPGTVMYDFDDPALDSSGNIVARMANISSGNMIVEFTTDGQFNMLVGDGDGTDQAQLVSGIYSNRYSLSDTGDVVFRANANDPNTAVYQQGIFRFSGGFNQQEVKITDKLAGFNGPISSFDNFFGIDSSGAISFVAHGATTVVYRKQAFTDAVRMIGMGDVANGFAINGLYQYALARNGDLYVYGSTSGGPNFLAVFAKGALPAKFYSMSGTYISSLLDANSTTGVVFTGDGGSGYGLYTWNPSRSPTPLPLIVRGRPLPTGEPFNDAYAATLDATGRVYASVQGVNSPWLLMSFGPPQILAATGDTVTVSANMNVSQNLVPGDRTGGFHIFAGGNQQSVFEITKQSINPLAVVNDKLPGGALYTGTNPIRKSASGAMYIVTDQEMFRLDQSGAAPLVSFPFIQDAVNVNSPYNMAVNDQGQSVFISGTNAGHQRLTLLNAGGVTQTIAYFGGSDPYLTPIPGGGTFSGLNDVAINESGTVMVNVTANGAQGGLFVYDGTGWQTVCQLQSCTLDGQAITTINQLKSAGSAFCAFFNTRLNAPSIRCWDSGTWTTFVNRGDVTSDGTEVNSIGAFDVNRKGQVAAVLFTQGLGGPSVFLKDSTGYTTVNANLFPLNGTTFRTIYSLDLRDDGRVFFIGMDVNDKMVVYEADPIH